MEITVDNQSVFLKVAGSGPKLVLCLHGYGNTSVVFDFLGKQLPEGVRMVAPDLPGFGESVMPKAQGALSDSYWLDLFQTILRSFPETRSIVLLGYSIGARIALHWFSNYRGPTVSGEIASEVTPSETISSEVTPSGTISSEMTASEATNSEPISFDPELPLSTDTPIKKVILIAPDGLRLHPLYRFCVKNPVGRWLFRKTLRHPAPFLFILRMLYKLKLLNKARYRFVRGEMGNKAKRELLERVWLGYAGLGKQLPLIRERSQVWKTSWHLIWGEKDRVILPKWGRKFANQVPGTEFTLIRGGHNLLQLPSKKLKVLLDNLLK